MCSLLQTTIWLAWILGGVFTLTLFCRGRIIHGGHISTTPDSARQSETSPPWCNTTRSSHGARPTAVARHRAQYPRALSVRRQTTQTDIRQIIYRQLRRRRTRSRFVHRRAALWPGCTGISSSTQLFLFDCTCRPTDNHSTELGVQQSAWVGDTATRRSWRAANTGLSLSTPILRHGPVYRQPERWRAVNTGTNLMRISVRRHTVSQKTRQV